jgi:adenylate cyclase, class 2
MSNNNLQEVEVKLYTPDLSVIQQSLDKLDANITIPRVYERNIRYENATQSFTEQGIVLRMRQDNDARLTYKTGEMIKNGIVSRYEAEVVVSDFDTMSTILGQLGFVPHMIYEKYRTTYTLDDAEIVLDEMPYGNFTEIEADINTIEHLITQLGLTDYRRITSSYTQIFDFMKSQQGLDFNDLTFDNFAEVDVPEKVMYSLDLS